MNGPGYLDPAYRDILLTLPGTYRILQIRVHLNTRSRFTLSPAKEAPK
jgi:hypothetical protein